MSESKIHPGAGHFSTSSDPSAEGQWSISGQIDESQPNRSFPLHKSPYSIGRSPDASLQIPVGCISKMHAELRLQHDGRLFLRDLGSTNGTFLNGEALTQEVEVFDGDLIQFATIVFRVGSQKQATQTNTIEENVGDHALAMMQFDRLINDGGLFPHFQPIVSLETCEHIGYEVLGRSRLFGLQTPMEMFLAASRLDLEAELSEAFRYRGVEIGSALGKDANLFLNTHPVELDRPELYDSLHSLRELNPEQTITLEIHEAAVTNVSMMKQLLAVLEELDIKLAFDDFGVGQARLMELGEVRPDFLKFDMGLTKNINEAPAKRQEVVALFAQMVNSLGIQTLAEGIETIECHETLVQMGFQLGQGFFYGRPAPISKYCDVPEEGTDTEPV
ncbi:MAG: EAL domain-containing protein [Planctomycetota bacterium]